MNIFLHLFGQPVCIVISLFLLINDVRMITFTHQLLKTVKPWQKLPQPHGAMVHQQCREWPCRRLENVVRQNGGHIEQNVQLTCKMLIV